MKAIRHSIVTMLLLSAGMTAALQAQEQAQEPATTAPPAAADAGVSTFDGAAKDVARQLEESVRELSDLRQKIAQENIPLNRKLSELEADLVKARQEFQQVTRLLDSRTLDLNTLRTEIKARQDETAYLANLFNEYIRGFESRLHIAELQRFRAPIEAAKLAVENSGLSRQEVFKAQAKLVEASLDRLADYAGGARFDGTAVDAEGLVKNGSFIVLGPAAIFAATDGSSVGTAEQRLGSLEPTIVPFQDPADVQAAASLVSTGSGAFPLDPTLGSAHKVEAIQETLLEHVKKGGPVMIPIFGIAGAALLVALIKWLTISLVRTPSHSRIKSLLSAIAKRDHAAAAKIVHAMPGPTGRMLAAGMEHITEPNELIEEVMFETVMTTRLKLYRWLPFIAITSSAAPLLGLLGTVTGIMNTFSLMTVFGTGDVKTLSSGISEALITTEFGLYVAIPSLLIYSLLSRKARSVLDHMEKTAVAFLNQLAKSRIPAAEKAA